MADKCSCGADPCRHAELMSKMLARKADLNRRWAEQHSPMTYEEDEDGDVTVYSAKGYRIAWMDKTAWDAIQARRAKVPTDG